MMTSSYQRILPPIMLALVALMAVPAAAGAATYERLPANTPAKPSFSPFADYTGAYSLRAHWAWLQGRSDGSGALAYTRCGGGAPFAVASSVCNSGGRVVIAVYDQGVDTTQPMFQGRVLQGADCKNASAGPPVADSPYAPCESIPSSGASDFTGHGTKVASAALASGVPVGASSDGFYGSAPGAMLMPLDKDGSTEYGLGQGIRWATDHGADVINLSWSYDGYLDTTPSSPTYNQVIQYTKDDFPKIASALAYATSRGVTAVCSSGNSNSGVQYPANDPNCIAVGSLGRDASGNWVGASGYGHDSTLDFMAAGDNAYVVSQSGAPGSDMGTSFSTPAVSGAVAVLLANGVPATGIYNALKSSSRDLGAPGFDTVYGWGLPDLGVAFGLGMPTVTVADPPVITDPGSGTGGTGGTGIPTITRCTGATLSVPLRGRVSFASRACALSFNVIAQSAAGVVTGSTYIAPTARLGTFSIDIQSSDGTKVQTITFVVTRQRVVLVAPSITCKASVRGRAACTVTVRIPVLTGGGRATVLIQHKTRVGGRYAWRPAGSFTVAGGRLSKALRSLPAGSYRLRSTTAATSLRLGGASAYASRTVR